LLIFIRAVGFPAPAGCRISLGSGMKLHCPATDDLTVTEIIFIENFMIRACGSGSGNHSGSENIYNRQRLTVITSAFPRAGLRLRADE